MVEAKLQRAPHQALHARGAGGRAASRSGRSSCEFLAVNHSIPDALAVAIRTGGRPGAAHRRLQDGPAAARRPAHRPARRSPGSATRASTCCWPTRPTPRCPGSPRRSATSPRCSTGCSRRPQQRVIVACFASHVHRVQQVLDAAVDARPQGRLRRPVDGAQHGRRPRPRLPARARPG